MRANMPTRTRNRRRRFENGRVWKRYDFDVMQALAEKGLISEPRGRAESVHLTQDGLQRAKALAQTLFGR